MEKIRTLINNKYLVVVSRLVVGGVFVFAGVTKIMEPIEDFIAIARGWDIVPDPLLTWYITALPWVEITFGMLLILGAFLRISSSIIGLTIVSFLIGIIVNMIRGRTLDECGCFGGGFEFGDTFSQLLWRDLFLMAVTLILIFTRQTWLSVDNYFKKSAKKEPPVGS